RMSIGFVSRLDCWHSVTRMYGHLVSGMLRQLCARHGVIGMSARDTFMRRLCYRRRWIARLTHVLRQIFARTTIAALGDVALNLGQRHRLVVIDRGRTGHEVGLDFVDAGVLTQLLFYSGR